MNLNNQKMIEEVSIDKTVQIAKKLANELIEISRIKKQKHPFKKEYLNKLIKRWKTNPGKHIIHLLDLPDYFTIKFSDNGKKEIKRIYDYFRIFGLSRLSRKYKINLYLIHELLITKRSSYLSVKSIKKLVHLISKFNPDFFEINKFEKEIIEIRPGKRAKSLKLENGLPIKLNDNKWASIFGIIFDSYLKKFNFATIDRMFIKEINQNLNQIGVCSFIINEKSIYKTGGQSIIGNLISLAGVSIDKNQLSSDNSLPKWVFSCTSEKFQKILLSKIIDTEGCAPDKRGMVRIAQSIKLDLSFDELNLVLSKSKKYMIKPSEVVSHITSFSKLPKESQDKFLSNPPLILISTQLLLRKYKINSQLYPLDVSFSVKGMPAARWHLIIQGYTSIGKLYELCNKFLTMKKEKFESYLSDRKRICLSKGLRISHYLINALKIQNNQGYFTTKDLIKMTKKNKKTVHNTVGYLARLNLIKTTDKGDNIKLWKITGKGMEHLENVCQNKEDWDYLFK